MNLKSLVTSALIAGAAIGFNVCEAKAQLTACSQNQYLYTKDVDDLGSFDYAFDVVFTSHNCGVALTGKTPSNPFVVALDQSGGTVFTNNYSYNAIEFVALDESIESSKAYLVAVGHENQQDDPTSFVVDKIDAVTGTVLWEREISYTPPGGAAEVIAAVDVKAEGGYYYILANTFDANDNSRAKDVVVTKLDAGGATVAMFSTAVWEPVVDPDAHMHGAALALYDSKVWVTGWTEVERPQQGTIEEAFLMELDQTTGAFLWGRTLRHTRDAAAVNSRPHGLWVGQLQGSATEIVIVGDLYTVSQSPSIHGAFATRYNSTLSVWDSRAILSPTVGREDAAHAYSVDYGLNGKRAWVVAGEAEHNSLRGAYLLEFDENWAYSSATYGHSGPEASTWTQFNSVVTQGINGTGPSPTLDYSYTAVGIIDGGPPANLNTYIVKVNSSLQTADGCESDPGPELDDLYVDPVLWGFGPKDELDNVSVQEYDRDWYDPYTYCEETIEPSPLKQGAEDLPALISTLSIQDDFASVISIDADNGVQFNFDTQQAGSVDLVIVDALGKTLTTQSINLTVGVNEVFIPVRFGAAGMYYAQIKSGGGMQTLPLSVAR